MTPADRSPPKGGSKRLAGLGLAALIVIPALALAYAGHQALMNARLLRADVGQVQADATLRRFAIRQAAPAFQKHCASCHGADLKGRPLTGAANLTDRDWLYGQGEVSEIEQTILYGVRSGHPKSRNLASMPAFAQAKPYALYAVTPLTPGEIRETVEYLRQLGGHDFDPAMAAAGQVVYRGKGGCFDCHAEDGSGDAAIGAPNLTDKIWLTGDGSRAAVEASIRQGRQAACPAWVKTLPPAMIRALAVYLFTVSHPSAAASPGSDKAKAP